MRTAYILLWFPVPTETFIFREVVNLKRLGLPLRVYTLYGPKKKNLTKEMMAVSAEVERLGTRALFRILADVGHWYARDPALVRHLFGAALFRRWRGIEKSAESFWAFLAGFHLARRFESDGIEHIHAPWANGPATAAWVVSRLTGKPFTFTGRAWDIYPPDALISRKISDASFVRCNNAANIRHLATFMDGNTDKFRLTYNGVTLQAKREAGVTMRSPYRFLAVGRMTRSKGFDQLLHAAKILADQGVDFYLTVAGGGYLRRKLERLARRLDIADRVHFPGFVSHDEIGDLFLNADLFVMSSVIAPSGDRDGIPNVIMEALMHRVPVVATDVCGIPELIENEVTGLLVPQNDPAALATAMKRCIDDRDFALELAGRGRERVREMFDPERNHRQLLELYRGLRTTS